MADPTAAAPEAPETTKKPPNKMLPVIIAAYVVTALGAAALVERVMAPAVAGRAAAAGGPEAHATASGGENKNRERKPGHGGGSAESAARSNVFLLEDLVVNPADSGGLRYLAATVGLRSNVDGFVDNMKFNEAPVKDALIRILSSKTVDELADVSQRESTRGEILAEVRRLVPDEDVDAVYFMRFVLQ